MCVCAPRKLLSERAPPPTCPRFWWERHAAVCVYAPFLGIAPDAFIIRGASACEPHYRTDVTPAGRHAYVRLISMSTDGETDRKSFLRRTFIPTPVLLSWKQRWPQLLLQKFFFQPVRQIIHLKSQKAKWRMTARKATKSLIASVLVLVWYDKIN